MDVRWTPSRSFLKLCVAYTILEYSGAIRAAGSAQCGTASSDLLTPVLLGTTSTK
jgi:hypothetical protein